MISAVSTWSPSSTASSTYYNLTFVSSISTRNWITYPFQTRNKQTSKTSWNRLESTDETIEPAARHFKTSIQIYTPLFQSRVLRPLNQSNIYKLFLWKAAAQKQHLSVLFNLFFYQAQARCYLMMKSSWKERQSRWFASTVIVDPHFFRAKGAKAKVRHFSMHYNRLKISELKRNGNRSIGHW